VLFQEFLFLFIHGVCLTPFHFCSTQYVALIDGTYENFEDTKR